jgi:threonine dehydratase
VLHGASGIQAFAHAHELERERGLVFVHPFDDEVVCSGAGTVGLELMEQVPDLDAVIVPIGGGGLISGVATAVKEISPRTRVYGVEPKGAPSTRMSLDAGHAVHLESLDTIADGLAAPMTGEVNYEIIRRYVDDVVLIDDDVIVQGMRELLVSTKLLAEPGGAAAVAALLARAIPVRENARVAAVVSGGNIELARLATLLG